MPSSEKPAWMKNIKKKKKLKKVSTNTGSTAARAKISLGIKGKKNLKKTSAPSTGLSETAKQQYRKKQQQTGQSFTEALDEKSLEYFNEVSARVYAEQCQFFLNAFWDEFGDQAEVIYSVHWDTMKKVDMENQGIAYLHLYEEGFDLDFDMGLLFFERLVQRFEGKNAAEAKQYPDAVPKHMTSIKRKKQLRNKVDVNFDGRVGMLEYLLYQFKASPKVLMERSTRSEESNPELDAARAALAEVNKRIKAYEAKKAKLNKTVATKTGVKQLKAKNMLAQIESGPLMETLRAALITAEAKVRIVAKRTKNKKSSSSSSGESGGQPRADGTIWWMKREIKEKKRLYGRRKAK